MKLTPRSLALAAMAVAALAAGASATQAAGGAPDREVRAWTDPVRTPKAKPQAAPAAEEPSRADRAEAPPVTRPKRQAVASMDRKRPRQAKAHARKAPARSLALRHPPHGRYAGYANDAWAEGPYGPQPVYRVDPDPRYNGRVIHYWQPLGYGRCCR